jgi:hypothetical protein
MRRLGLLWAVVLGSTLSPAAASDPSTSRSYSVLLTRVEAKAGPRANFRVEVRAPDAALAKRTAEAQFPGYRAKHGASLKRDR